MEHSLSSPNHNQLEYENQRNAVALYPLSSPNHNRCISVRPFFPLRYILFHHQTTTIRLGLIFLLQLRYILFHHQTTTSPLEPAPSASCVISSFITKPQHMPNRLAISAVALYPLSSPNHNLALLMSRMIMLRYILFHHQTTTGYDDIPHKQCCVISSFITKPQRASIIPLHSPVALYPLSSPNHNLSHRSMKSLSLRYILFHHQTTTAAIYWP